MNVGGIAAVGRGKSESESEETDNSEPDVSTSTWAAPLPVPPLPHSRPRFHKRSLHLKRKSGTTCKNIPPSDIPPEHPPLPHSSLQHQLTTENDLFSSSCKCCLQMLMLSTCVLFALGNN